MARTVTCPFCGGDATVINDHWIDPMVECSCQQHLMRMSELEVHNGTSED